jgi:predicted Rossmann fold nucleotide-binding protein DprA/Smf involved in DNA uptake
LARNKDIVRETDFLVIAPHGNREILRSGTWQTARFAKKSGKHVIQLYTEGGCVVFA